MAGAVVKVRTSPRASTSARSTGTRRRAAAASEAGRRPPRIVHQVFATGCRRRRRRERSVRTRVDRRRTTAAEMQIVSSAGQLPKPRQRRAPRSNSSTAGSSITPLSIPFSQWSNQQICSRVHAAPGRDAEIAACAAAIPGKVDPRPDHEPHRCRLARGKIMPGRQRAAEMAVVPAADRQHRQLPRDDRLELRRRRDARPNRHPAPASPASADNASTRNAAPSAPAGTRRLRAAGRLRGGRTELGIGDLVAGVTRGLRGDLHRPAEIAAKF